MRDIVRLCEGYIDVKTNAQSLESILNFCCENDIYVTNVSHSADGCVFTVSIISYRKITKFARKNRLKTKIAKKHGLPFFINTYKKRYFLIIGILICVLLLNVLSSFIWNIEIQGNVNVDANDIKKVLSDYGFSPGRSKYGHDIVRLRDKIIINVDGIAWAWIYINGSKALVSVKETVPAPEIIPLDVPSSIIAKCDAMVFELIAKRGTAKVKAGDGVIKGQVLISGVNESQLTGARLVHSFGSVKGRTWSSVSREYSLKETQKSYTGNKKSQYTLNFFKKRIKLYQNAGISYTSYDTIHNEYNLFSDNSENGISVMKDTFVETLVTPRFGDIDELERVAVSQLLSEIIKSKDESAVLEEYTHTVTKTDEDTVCVTVDAVFIEDIGVEIPITDKELTEN